MTSIVGTIDATPRRPLRLAARPSVNGGLWTLQALVGTFFVGSGFGKILLADASLYAAAPRAVAWYGAVPQPLIVFIGICEVLGGLGLVLPAMTGVKPRLTVLAAAGLTLVMVLAAGFHILRGEVAFVPMNVVLGGFAAFIAAGRLSLRPIASAEISTGRVLKALRMVAVLAVVVCAPTWYTMTHVQF
jgi:hypothetical protein